MDIAISAKYLLSLHGDSPMILENQTILIDSNRITSIGSDLDIRGRQVHDFNHHVVMPGLVNGHTHAAMTLFRGFVEDIPLNEWLNQIWPIEAKLTFDDVKIATKLASVEALLSGTTVMNSMYWHPDAEAEAFNEIGLRSMIGSPIISGVNTLGDYERLITDWHGKNDDLVRVAISPHAPYTVTEEEYRSLHEYKTKFNEKLDAGRPKILIHTHVAETKSEMSMIRDFASRNDFSIDDSLSTPIQYLDAIGVLDETVIAAHSVECDHKDIEILSDRNVGVSLNPVSNMKLGNGTAKMADMIDRNVKVGIGTDGPASNNSLNMFETIKTASLLQKSHFNDPTKINAFNSLKTATFGGAQVLGWNEIGSIEENKYADLIFIDLNVPHLKPIVNRSSIPALIVYSAQASDVTDVMINGVWKVKDRKPIDVDLLSLYDTFEETVKNLMEQ